MPDSPMVSMVVPTYNERERLEHFVRTLVGVLRGADRRARSSSSTTTRRTGLVNWPTASRATCPCASCTAAGNWGSGAR